MMNKTTLEGLEEALERLEQIDGVYSWGHLLFEVREALAEPDWYEEAMRLGGLNAKHVGELKQLRAEPVKHEVNQEPVGEMIDKNGYKGAAWYCEPPITGTKLYAAPIDAKAIREAVRAEAFTEAKEHFSKQLVGFRASVREQALEEAAKVCEEGTGNAVQANVLKVLRQERERIAEAIRGLK
jgi:hypothetical protein